LRYLYLRIVVLNLVLVCTILPAYTQGNFRPFSDFQKLTLYIDTLVFDSQEDIVMFNRKQHLAFEYLSNEQVVRAELYLSGTERPNIKLLANGDFDIIDSMQWVNNAFYRFKIRFKSLSDTEFLNFTFEFFDQEKKSKQQLEVPLFPYTKTQATFYTGTEDLYVGESKMFEIVSNNVDNLKLDGIWKKQNDISYRLVSEGSEAVLYLQPEKRGSFDFVLDIETKRPFLDEQRRPRHKLPVIKRNINVREGRLAFLRIDRRDVILDRDNRQGIEIQLDNNRNLKIGKTYRIEDRETPGGPLIAEIYTQRLLSNDKVLCLIRPYSTHRTAEGYLYIKDGDVPMFITNVDIIPKSTIQKVSILREGQEWSSNLQIRPGETIDIKLEGQSLTRGRFVFEDLEDISGDTLTRSDNIANYRVRVPLRITKRSVEIFNRSEKTGIQLQVREFQRPRPLDFVFLNYGEGPKAVNSFDQPVLYPQTIKDIVISYDPNKIDRDDLLYGRQFVRIRVRIESNTGQLLEMVDLGVFSFCPGETSPRQAFYQETGCRLDDIRINNFISKKTHGLNEWSKIEVFFEHDKERYNNVGYTQRITLYNQRLVSFDVDVSFPAGLIIARVGEKGFPGLGGISLAMMGQFSFYKPGEIQRLKPYKIGAGFLAQNAFNFNAEAKDRDLGIVVIGSVYPIQRSNKLSFPLFGGFGYFLNAEKFFFLIGPGIRVQL
jgi:hypothetical protein